MGRPHKREDGFLTRIDQLWQSPAELAIAAAMRQVEATGASTALTDAVVLLSKARERVADHVESAEAFWCDECRNAGTVDGEPCVMCCSVGDTSP